MEVGQPDVLEQVPVSGNPMKPSSGSYGDVKATDDLKAALNLPGEGPGPGGPGGSGPPPPGMPQGTNAPAPKPGTVPDVLMGPTTQPDVPQSQGLAAQGQAAPSPGPAAHIAALEALVKSSTTSKATKQWAEMVLARYKS